MGDDSDHLQELAQLLNALVDRLRGVTVKNTVISCHLCDRYGIMRLEHDPTCLVAKIDQALQALREEE